MITQITKDNAAKYQKLFREAEAVLSGYIPVKTYTEGTTYYSRSGAEFNEEIEITDVVSFAKRLTELEKAEGNETLDRNLYYKDESIKDDAFHPGVDTITTLEEYYFWLHTLKKATTEDNKYYWMKFIQLPLDEAHFKIDANNRSITVPSEFKKNGIGVQGDHMAEVVYFEIERFFDYMDLDQCDIYIQWEAPKSQSGVNVSEVCYKQVYVDDNNVDKLVFAWAISDALTQNAGSLKFSVRFFKWKDGQSVDNEIKELEYSYSTLTATASIQTALSLDLTTLTTDQIDDSCKLIGDRIGQTQLNGGYHAAEPEFILNLIEDANGADLGSNGTAELYVIAEAPDTGLLEYNWYKTNLNEDNSEGETESLSEFKVSNYSWYKVDNADIQNLLNQGITLYYRIKETENEFTILTGTTIDTDTYEYCIKGSGCKVDSVGRYYVQVSNRTTGSIRYVLSNKVSFYNPVIPEVTKSIDNKFIIGQTTEPLKIEVKEVYGNKPVYNWETNGDPMAMDAEYTSIDGANEATYMPTEPGYYKVSVCNTRNEKTSEPASGEGVICRVTNLPNPVTCEIVGSKEFYDSSFEEGKVVLNPTIKLKDESLSDGCICHWYIYEDKTPKEITNINVAAGSSVSLNINEYRSTIEDKTDGNINAMYYAVIDNILNGETTSWDMMKDGKIYFLIKEAPITVPDEELEVEEEPTVDEE